MLIAERAAADDLIDAEIDKINRASASKTDALKRQSVKTQAPGVAQRLGLGDTPPFAGFANVDQLEKDARRAPRPSRMTWGI